MSRILVVEDDPAMSVALRDGFAFEKHVVATASDGEEALHAARALDHDVIILDVMLPKKSGLDVCRELRKSGNNTPIIMLTARGQEVDKVVGLKLGADDYITKPFSFMELLARLEAVMRRTRRELPPDQVAFGDVKLDFRKYQATRGGQPLDLTQREFRILRYFLDHANAVVTREALLHHVWGYDPAALTRTVDTHVARLRQKIESKPAEPQHLLTVHRAGYRFVP
ncbi:MAG TPA: response regulator transcription factor [Thermoanaerobaculia bacterium]|nr:response regulator transcription factor [Thermoanaerobaculia bacterium]